jgi:hypothetical protein
MRVLLIGLALALAATVAAQPGVEPHPGERLGTVGGGNRLSDEYWEREKRLEDDVERARKRLDAAIVRWNAVR